MFKLPVGVDINNLIDNLRIFSWQAADYLIYYSKLLKEGNMDRNFYKTDNMDDPVTMADLKVNELIIQKIRENYVGIDWNIMSEENAKVEDGILNSQTDWLWILDPLDGTKDFIQGTGDYAMHLALNYKNRPYLGVVLIPEKDELWIAFGNNVWCEKRDGSKTKPKLANKKNLQEMVLVTSKNHNNEILRNLIKQINCGEVIEMGSIGCKIASIIRGDSDIYISLSLPGKSSPKDWDLAAPEAILKGSGGLITDINNRELLYGKTKFEQSGILIASNNSEDHYKICFEVKKIIKEYDLYPLGL